MNIVDPILHQSHWQPLAPALCAPGNAFNLVTYGQLEQMVRNIIKMAGKNGIASGQIVALYVKDPILHALLILALTKLGAVPLSAAELVLPPEVPVDAHIVDASVPADAVRGAILVDRNWLLGNTPRSDLANVASTRETDLCRIILTSGTTGLPKAVALEHRMLSRRITRFAYLADGRFSECSRLFVDMGLSTVGGYQYLFYTLSRGGTVFMRGTSAMETLKALTAHRVQAIFSSPQALAQLADLCEREVPTFQGFDYVMAAGSLLTKATAERLCQRLGANVISIYGSTETGTAATTSASTIRQIEGAVGQIIPGMTVEIVSPSGEVLPPGREGRIRIRGASAVTGYYQNSEASREKFDEGGFYPGDMGLITPSGVLVISGRENTVVNLGGNKVLPERVETALCASPHVCDAAIFTTANALGIHEIGGAIVWREGPRLDELRAHLHQSLPAKFIPKSFIALEAIPRNASGKIDREKLKELVSPAPKAEVH